MAGRTTERSHAGAGTPTSGSAGTARASGADRVRQVAVLAAAVVCILGGVLGSGVWIGEPVAEAAGGALSADATFLAPAGAAFSVWSVIYAALVVFTVWHTLPGRAADALARTVGWWAAASMVLNAVWLLSIQTSYLWLSILVILGLALVLGLLLVRANGVEGVGAGPVVVGVTFGLYLGWTSVATCANVAAVLVDAGVDPGRRVGELVGVGVLAVVCLLVWLLATRVGVARWAVVATVVWGLAWIAVGRLGDEPESFVVGVAAVVAAGASVLLTALASRTVRRS